MIPPLTPSPGNAPGAKATKRRKKPFSATKRALVDLKALGFRATVVEKRLPRCFITKDAFGFGDILAMRPGIGVLLIQVTSGANHASRKTKLSAIDEAAFWLASGGKIELWSYRLAGKAGKRKTYALRREEIRMDDLSTSAELAAATSRREGDHRE